MWKQLNEGEGDWVWLKMKVLTDAYSAADAKAREEFSLIGKGKHLKSGYVKQMEDFIDEEKGNKYRQYKRSHGLFHMLQREWISTLTIKPLTSIF